MKTEILILQYFSVFSLMILLILCNKEVTNKDKYVIIGLDTISLVEILELSPEKNVTPAKIYHLCFTFVLAREASNTVDNTEFAEIIKDFQEQLTRETEYEWTKHAAQQLYLAAKKIKENLDQSKDKQSFYQYMNNIAEKIKVSSAQNSFNVKLISDLFYQTTSLSEKKSLYTPILTKLLALPPHLASIITEFIFSEDINKGDINDAGSLVKGLFQDSIAKPKKERKNKKKTHQLKNNIHLALKHRNQQSIQRSIQKHLPSLQALYKKELKSDPNMNGIIYITFRINPSGKVLSATIKSSQIKNRKFINPFLTYTKRIRFKPIPEKIGIMTFDFPFEFRPEY